MKSVKSQKSFSRGCRQFLKKAVLLCVLLVLVLFFAYNLEGELKNKIAPALMPALHVFVFAGLFAFFAREKLKTIRTGLPDFSRDWGFLVIAIIGFGMRFLNLFEGISKYITGIALLSFVVFWFSKNYLWQLYKETRQELFQAVVIYSLLMLLGMHDFLQQMLW